ncbi:DUF29 domain-containing protein [Thermocrinis sp.]
MLQKTPERSALKELYEKDFYLWVMENLRLLKEKHYEEVDWENLLEEIKDMGQRHLESAISYMAIILEHLYKWENFRTSPEMGHGWIKSIINARVKLKRLYDGIPSLYGKSRDEMDRAWRNAVMGLVAWFHYPRNKDLAKKFFGRLPTEKDFPAQCPYTFEQVLEYKPWLEEVWHEDKDS